MMLFILEDNQNIEITLTLHVAVQYCYTTQLIQINHCIEPKKLLHLKAEVQRGVGRVGVIER